MKIVLAGGSGFIGKKLIEQLLRDNHILTLLSRSPKPVQKRWPLVRVQFWNANSTHMQIGEIIEGADAIINLSGESISSRRWTNSQKKRILHSRIQSTRALVSALDHVKQKPSVLLNASAVGYYGNVPEGDVTEEYPKGNGFLSDVCEQWEIEAMKAKKHGVRVVVLRSGVVLDKNGGAFPRLVLPFRFMMGGPLGTGRQWFPWIHLQDEVNAILFALKNEKITGSSNLAAPETVQMKDFCTTLGRLLHRPSWLSIPEIALKTILGEMAGPLLLEGQRIIPKKLIDTGFKFQFPKLDDALLNILTQ
jgi:uncharacterized protein